MYNGRLHYQFCELISLVELSQYYGIDQLHALLEQRLKAIDDKPTLSILIRECFDKGCAYSLSLLEDALVRHFQEFEIEELSDLLDVGTFARVLGRTETDNVWRIALIETFLGTEYTVDKPEEKKALFNALRLGDPGLKERLVGKPWLREADINSLR
jgi:hypothetical protein